MNNRLFYIAVDTAALGHAQTFLETRGCKTTRSPSSDVTHLLLPVPSISADGTINTGSDQNALQNVHPKDITVIGGNLQHNSLHGYRTMDLLQDEHYQAHNAAITAACALRIATQTLPITLQETPVLVLGWGRIAKCLARLLHAIGAEVTIAARKHADLAIAAALGYGAVHLGSLTPRLGRYRILFNTIPAMVLPDSQAYLCRPDCVKIDLASAPGIGGSGVIWARGLPGKMAPETAGHLIAKTVLAYCFKKEVTA